MITIENHSTAFESMENHWIYDMLAEAVRPSVPVNVTAPVLYESPQVTQRILREM